MGRHGRWLQHDDAPASDTYEAFLAGRCRTTPCTVDVRRGVAVGSGAQLYTGAFGGTPNGALLSHRAIISQALMVAMLQRIDRATPST